MKALWEEKPYLVVNNFRLMFKTLASVVFLFFALSVYAQEKLVLLNGSEVQGKLQGIDSNFVSIQTMKKDKPKTMIIERYRVYSYTDSVGRDTIIYIPNPAEGNTFTTQEAEYFMYGQLDAGQSFRPHLTHITAFSVMLGLSILDTYQGPNADNNNTGGFFYASPSFMHLAAPFLITLAARIPGITFDLNKMSNRSFLIEPSYREGFTRVIKNKRTFGALKFSLAGSLVGIGIWAIAKP